MSVLSVRSSEGRGGKVVDYIMKDTSSIYYVTLEMICSYTTTFDYQSGSQTIIILKHRPKKLSTVTYNKNVNYYAM